MKWKVARCVTIFKEGYCDQKKMLPVELKRTEPGRGHSNLKNNLCAQYNNPCRQYNNPCARYNNPCAQYNNPCAQYNNPCTQYNNPCAQFNNPCAQFNAVTTKQPF